VLRLLEKFNLEPPVSDEVIRSAETALKLKLPDRYVAFLKAGNGGEGFIGESYAILWDVSEIEALNQSYESGKVAPGLLIFGSDGGDEAFGFDTRSADWLIVQIPFIGMSWDLARPLGSTFDQFLENLYAWNRL
jgi:SMI1 / KNR4 family (SUKH-1)